MGKVRDGIVFQLCFVQRRPRKVGSVFSAVLPVDRCNEGGKEAVGGFFVSIVAGFPRNDGGQRNRRDRQR